MRAWAQNNTSDETSAAVHAGATSSIYHTYDWGSSPTKITYFLNFLQVRFLPPLFPFLPGHRHRRPLPHTPSATMITPWRVSPAWQSALLFHPITLLNIDRAVCPYMLGMLNWLAFNAKIITLITAQAWRYGNYLLLWSSSALTAQCEASGDPTERSPFVFLRLLVHISLIQLTCKYTYIKRLSKRTVVSGYLRVFASSLLHVYYNICSRVYVRVTDDSLRKLKTNFDVSWKPEDLRQISFCNC